jgi:hypothetical protein
MMKRSVILPLMAVLVLEGAETLVPRDRSELEVTIYNDNRIFVHEIREAEVAAGKQRLVYEGVAGSVISASVVPTFTGIDTRLSSQNYSYDLVSLPSLLKHSVGREISFMTNGENPVRSEGTLLAYDPVVMVREKGTGRILSLEKPSQVIFHEIPAGMITRPSLIWNIETAEAGKLGIDLKYLATGVSWKSDYVLNLGPDTFDLTGWITVDNRSGVSYPDAKITCLAGEVHKAGHPRVARRMAKAMPVMADAAVREEAFSGYHIYHIPFRETIADKERKQIRFLHKPGVNYLSYGKAQIRSFPRAGVEKLRFVNTVEFVNSKKEGLGVPLPAGVVRMYRRDKSGAARFIGESRIGNIPADEKVTLQVGVLFDAVGEKKIVKYVSRKGYLNVAARYTLRNRGETPLTLKIEERIPVHGDRIELRSDCSGPCSVRKLSAFVREFTVRLKAKESYAFESEFEVWR